MGVSSTPSPEQRQIRVFLSSTFVDFLEERELLSKRGFPALNRRARDRGVELVDIDLRWGVTEEQTRQGLSLIGWSMRALMPGGRIGAGWILQGCYISWVAILKPALYCMSCNSAWAVWTTPARTIIS